MRTVMVFLGIKFVNAFCMHYGSTDMTEQQGVMLGFMVCLICAAHQDYKELTRP